MKPEKEKKRSRRRNRVELNPVELTVRREGGSPESQHLGRRWPAFEFGRSSTALSLPLSFLSVYFALTSLSKQYFSLRYLLFPILSCS
jgi:hypothetical protein